MKNPIFMKDAKSIAETAAGRKLTYDKVWLTQQVGGSWVVNYKMPRTTGWFACNEELNLSWEEAEQYEAWNIDRSSQS